MTIVVYGAGAVGAFWGGLLARAGHDVGFVARGRQLEALQRQGLRISSRTLGELTVHPVRAADSAAAFGVADIVLVCVKTHQMPGILDDLQNAAGDETVFIALQNGIEADDVLVARFGPEHVAGAVVYVGTSVPSPGVVSHVARGLLIMGNQYDVSEARFAAVVGALSVPGLQARRADDFERQRWYKLMWNTSFNAASALTLGTSTTLLGQAETRDLILSSMREVVAVAQAKGIDLTEADVTKSIADTEQLDPIRTSMLQDREQGRPMEVEALVGVVVRLGRELGVPTPVTSVLYGLLKAIEPRPT